MVEIGAEPGAVGAALAGARWRLDRARYQLQQWGLLMPLTLGNRLLRRLSGIRPARPASAADLAVAERRFRDLLAEDLANVERGVYPRDLLFQFPLGQYLRAAPEALADVPRVIRRRRLRQHQDLPGTVDLRRYPAYFRRTFHWQTDGYLSRHSARIYDVSVEFLFAGTADVMRRMAIAPLIEDLRGREAPTVLDLGAGTGRFLGQLARALPAARLYALDLSAFYLAEAEALLAGVPWASFLAENAERTSLRDASMDACASIFLFHELPPAARRQVAAEALRVLRPGGRFVVLDSAQRGDGKDIEGFLEQFPTEYHEPFYQGYLDDDLGALFAEQGFEVEETRPFFLSKRVVARRPR